MKITMYLIERGGEYYGTNGFWRATIYSPNFYKTVEEAQQDLNALHTIDSEDAKIVPAEIEI